MKRILFATILGIFSAHSAFADLKEITVELERAVTVDFVKAVYNITMIDSCKRIEILPASKSSARYIVGRKLGPAQFIVTHGDSDEAFIARVVPQGFGNKIDERVPANGYKRVDLNQLVKNIEVANPDILVVRPVGNDPKKMDLLGLKAGYTKATFTFADNSTKTVAIEVDSAGACNPE